MEGFFRRNTRDPGGLPQYPGWQLYDVYRNFRCSTMKWLCSVVLMFHQLNLLQKLIDSNSIKVYLKSNPVKKDRPVT